MDRYLFLARMRANQRKSWYGLIALLVIGSMLLRPVTAIAVIYKIEADLQNALAARVAPLDRGVAHAATKRSTDAMYVMDRLRIAAALPAPAIRTLAQVNPTPSLAKPAYPDNHILDGVQQAIGTSPTNHNFETAATGGGSPPANHDFESAPYTVGTPPTNADFESGDFTGWTTSGSTSIQSDATQGYWAQLQTNGKIVSDPFTVDSAAQQITFLVNHASSSTSGFHVYIHSDPSYSTRTRLLIDSCANCGWVPYSVDISAYAGQSVKIEFLRSSGTIGIDNSQQAVLFPNYTATGSLARIVEAGGNGYARLGSSGTLTSAPFTIGSSVQQLSLSLSGLTTRSDQYRVELLSDPNYSTATQLGLGTVSDSWQQFAYNVSAWQGQAVKLRIASVYSLGAVGVDEIGIQEITLPGWTVTGATEVVDEGNGNHFASTTGEMLSDPFVLDPAVQQISLRYRGDDGAADTFYVKLLRGANFSEEVDLAGYLAAGADWQTLKIGINLYAGETVKLKLQRHFGRIYFDDAGAGEIVLPGWQPTGTEGIATAADGHGSYVTAADGAAFFIRSVPIETGIIDHPFRVDARYYAIGYDIGYATGSLLQVFWINDQGQQYTAFQAAADNPTGYQEGYFPIYESVGTSGHFVVKATGGGKVYSIADNIARQHLNEPFSIKSVSALTLRPAPLAIRPRICRWRAARPSPLRATTTAIPTAWGSWVMAGRTRTRRGWC
ncbi:MAG: hypothetical protein R2867_17300 [Caldilineaceae bacterium]